MKPSKYTFRKMAHRHLSKFFDKKCMKCGSCELVEIDHIKPSSKYPELEFALDNVQFLCRPCNASKGNRNCMGYEPIYEEPKEVTREEYFKQLFGDLNKNKKERVEGDSPLEKVRKAIVERERISELHKNNLRQMHAERAGIIYN